MMKYGISEDTFRVLYRYFVEHGGEITYKEGLTIEDELKKMKYQKNTPSKPLEKDTVISHQKGLPEIPANKRVYFDVFYADKTQAKELGARWDKDLKLWYAEDGSEVCDKMRMVFEVKEVDNMHHKY